MVWDAELVARRFRGAGMAFLVAAFLIGGTSLAGARTRPLGPGPIEQGDPTADDQPSPTPKQNLSSGVVAIQRNHQDAVRGNRSLQRLDWVSYVRIMIRISMR